MLARYLYPVYHPPVFGVPPLKAIFYREGRVVAESAAAGMDGGSIPGLVEYEPLSGSTVAAVLGCLQSIRTLALFPFFLCTRVRLLFHCFSKLQECRI